MDNSHSLSLENQALQEIKTCYQVHNSTLTPKSHFVLEVDNLKILFKVCPSFENLPLGSTHHVHWFPTAHGWFRIAVKYYYKSSDKELAATTTQHKPFDFLFLQGRSLNFQYYTKESQTPKEEEFLKIWYFT